VEIIGSLILAALIFGAGGLAAGKVVAPMAARVPERARARGRQAGRTARSAASRGRQRAEPLRLAIARPFAEARAQNWLDRKRAQRDARALRPQRSLLTRLTTPKGAPDPGAPPAPAPVPLNGRHLQAVPARPSPARSANGNGNGKAHDMPGRVCLHCGDPDRARDALRELTGYRGSGLYHQACASGRGPEAAGEFGRASSVTTGTTANGSGAAAGLGAGADMLTSVQQLTTHCASAGIEGKQRSYTVAAESFSFMAAQFSALASKMAEPGQAYPPSAYEPWQIVAAHLQAAAMAAGEGGSVIQSIRSMTVGELAGSSIRAPHHDELNKA
jgi:hypothetical protein